MKTKILDLIDFKKVDSLLEGFNNSTGFVTAILDLEGNVLSKSGWRQICTEFHRVHPETSKKCTISDTVLANKMEEGEKYHFYQCLNGLVDVAVPIVINGEHIANLFSGQFFFEQPDSVFFKKQAEKYGFSEEVYLKALGKVPVVSKEKVLVAMDFLLNMTQLISEMTFQKLEQTESNKTIIESEEKFKVVFESANVGKSITLPTGEINVNLAFCDMLGYTRDELQNKKWQDITPEDEIPTIQALTNPLLKGEKDSVRFEKRYICQNGTHIWADVSVSSQRDKNGKLLHFITTIIDISERKQAEERIIESEKRYRSLFENMNAGFELFEVVQNEQGIPVDLIILAANEGFEKTTGLKLSDSIGKRLTQVLPSIEKDKADWIGTFSKVALSGESVQFEQGSELLGYYYSISAFQSGPKLCAVTFVDITERKKAEEKLRESESRFRKLYEDGANGMVMAGKDFKFLMANRTFCQMTGYQELELQQLTFSDITHPDDKAKDIPVVKKMISGEIDVYRTEKRYVKKDGQIFWAQLTVSPIDDANGQFLYFVGIIVNVTERKQAEEKIRENSLLIRIAAEKAKLGGWNVDLKENRSYWSDEVAAIHEMPPGYAPLVEDGINFYAPEWRERIIKVFTECAVNGVPYDEEMEIITSTGRRVWIRTIGEAVRDENGKILKVEGAFQDISEKKMAEEKSREKDLQFRKLSANVPDLIFQFTRKPDGTYCVPVASEGIRNIFGCTPEDVVNDFTPIGKVIYPDDAERVIADIENSAKHLKHFTSEFRVQIPGKPIQWILSRSTPEKLPDESITWYGFNTDITQRKEFEDALRESEGKFRKIYEEGPFGMALVNSSFKFIMVNRTFCEITGYTESVLRELTFRDITYPDDKDIGVESVKKLIKGEIPVFRSEKRYVRKDGQVIWGAITVTAHFDKNGNFLYNLAIVEDITGRKQADEVLREREYLLSSSQRVAHIGTWSWKVGDTSTYWSDETYRIYGLSPEMGPPEFEFFFKIIHPEDRLKMQEWPQAVLAGLHPDPIEFRVLRPDGIYRVIRTEGDVIETVDNVPSRIAGTAYDITERKLADEKIKTLNERLQLLVEAIQELSISTSMESIMATVRTSARKLVNADGSTFILRDGDSCYYADEDTVSPLWKGQRFPLTNCISGWAMLNKQSVIIEDIYADDRIPIEAYKSTFVKSLAIAPIRLNDPLGAIGAYWGRNYLPSEIEVKLLNTLADAAAKAVENVQLIEGLEQKISERTSQLQAVNKELETFTYSVSHDLKAPLRGIDGYSKLLSDLYANELNDEARHFISTIRKSTQLMSQLIDDLLQYSRLERSQLRSEPVMIKPFINSILKVNEDEITSHRFSVITDIPEIAIIADYNGIQMALRNLIENAIKFTKTVPDPSIEIKQEESERCWIISVKDNGIGFDMKYSQRIFEIFQRLHRVEDYPGTGIGLAMVGKAMQRMNGRAWAESTPGKGATFYLEIPKQI